ncbi:hypothetical protein EVAR_25174_1 [Eumeta japonica]|uniref:Uncharacterized protein n=1 Tax=Eumeta variegata TaxID=151549 RepID=A0A4C1VQD6_EUMVA|nr:hypothetical protein EVAR_25174_1 [Eumeta japonica]
MSYRTFRPQRYIYPSKSAKIKQGASGSESKAKLKQGLSITSKGNKVGELVTLEAVNDHKNDDINTTVKETKSARGTSAISSDSLDNEENIIRAAISLYEAPIIRGIFSDVEILNKCMTDIVSEINDKPPHLPHSMCE